jgi:hypothetical protein
MVRRYTSAQRVVIFGYTYNTGYAGHPRGRSRRLMGLAFRMGTYLANFRPRAFGRSPKAESCFRLKRGRRADTIEPATLCCFARRK